MLNYNINVRSSFGRALWESQLASLYNDLPRQAHISVHGSLSA